MFERNGEERETDPLSSKRHGNFVVVYPVCLNKSLSSFLLTVCRILDFDPVRVIGLVFIRGRFPVICSRKRSATTVTIKGTR